MAPSHQKLTVYSGTPAQAWPLLQKLFVPWDVKDRSLINKQRNTYMVILLTLLEQCRQNPALRKELFQSVIQYVETSGKIFGLESIYLSLLFSERHDPDHQMTNHGLEVWKSWAPNAKGGVGVEFMLFEDMNARKVCILSDKAADELRMGQLLSDVDSLSANLQKIALYVFGFPPSASSPPQPTPNLIVPVAPAVDLQHRFENDPQWKDLHHQWVVGWWEYAGTSLILMSVAGGLAASLNPVALLAYAGSLILEILVLVKLGDIKEKLNKREFELSHQASTSPIPSNPPQGPLENLILNSTGRGTGLVTGGGNPEGTPSLSNPTTGGPGENRPHSGQNIPGGGQLTDPNTGHGGHSPNNPPTAPQGGRPGTGNPPSQPGDPWNPGSHPDHPGNPEPRPNDPGTAPPSDHPSQNPRPPPGPAAPQPKPNPDTPKPSEPPQPSPAPTPAPEPTSPSPAPAPAPTAPAPDPPAPAPAPPTPEPKPQPATPNPGQPAPLDPNHDPVASGPGGAGGLPGNDTGRPTLSQGTGAGSHEGEIPNDNPHGGHLHHKKRA